jgi:very-short-patch-repair endonuclease
VRTDLRGPDSEAHFKSERAVVIARRLRKEATPAERALWFELRRLRPSGTHFRRQVPFGPFIVDFACHRAKLVVEIDGGAHNAPNVASRDVERQQWIVERGYRVLRFTNADVLCDVRAVARRIFEVAARRIEGFARS